MLSCAGGIFAVLQHVLGEACLKNGSTQNIGLVCQVSSGLEAQGLAEQFQH